MKQPPRVLVVEDELVIAMLAESALAGAGYRVIGPVGHLAVALEAAGEETLDAALLDINLAGQAVYPVADILAGRNVPFAFVTGHDPAIIPPEHRHRPIVTKPYRAHGLLAAVSKLIWPPAP
jgi:DNA-binding response OmpR family regulator